MASARNACQKRKQTQRGRYGGAVVAGTAPSSRHWYRPRVAAFFVPRHASAVQQRTVRQVGAG